MIILINIKSLYPFTHTVIVIWPLLGASHRARLFMTVLTKKKKKNPGHYGIYKIGKHEKLQNMVLQMVL